MSDHVDLTEDGPNDAVEMRRLVKCDVDVTLQGMDEFEYRAANLALDPVSFDKAAIDLVHDMGPVFRLCCPNWVEREMFMDSLFP